ncbi:Gfo/Idh/MocA family protein [Brachybacterium saurashtrense]|uniref:Gfo/Idh/MocA family oxidoreductase n=1 Tax=Brachybacterium saurashtrense TaxID=556288 RepID=A0A345YQZ6_9MICO|nr:Gfo/Idh/MocA family oxidoreductase [Brachybacterium saurashtrense]AXK46348.1 gfo/Idh/MocA family oxidoreductase [Brachybacterium saurashtrense]RRR24088.1 gfo/Idh/MocA family oxidoreductase [Brachybacterium saurashtrense]
MSPSADATARLDAATGRGAATGPDAVASGVAPVRVALLGTRGFGAVHLRTLSRLAARGIARLVGVVDVAEPPPELAGIHHRSLAALLEATPEADRPEVVAIATPIGTHLELATEALAAGLDVYLEKPPVPSLEDHWRLLEAAEAAGRSVQVGFQARGGAGVDVLREEVATGALGRIEAVHVYGAWLRDRAYYARSAWAGKRRLDGRRVADGVATNPLAHSVHAGLAIAGIDDVADIAAVTVELRHAHDIEADDTAFLRIDPAGEAPAVVCALTTVAAEQTSPWIEIRGSGGGHRLYYTEDRSVRTAADGTAQELAHEREDLMENLLAHVRDRSVPLRSPLASTGVFSAVLEATQSVPDPLPIEAGVTWAGEGEAAHPVVDGIEQTLRTALATGQPFSELGVPWARPDAVHRWTPPA